MPSGSVFTIPTVVEIIKKLNPRTILDLGAGYGKYGPLLKEFLSMHHGILAPANSPIKVTGVECELRYRWCQDATYHAFHWCSIQEYLAQHSGDRFDVGMLVDVFEHLERDDGCGIVASIKTRCKAILILVPVVWFDNKLPGYPTEEHRTQWTPPDFVAMGFETWDDNGARYALWRQV